MRPPALGLLWRARLRLAGLSLVVMGALLYAAGFTMGRLLQKTQETAIRRELQTLAVTMHNSLKPVLPRDAVPFPGSQRCCRGFAWLVKSAAQHRICSIATRAVPLIPAATNCGCSTTTGS